MILRHIPRDATNHPAPTSPRTPVAPKEIFDEGQRRRLASLGQRFLRAFRRERSRAWLPSRGSDRQLSIVYGPSSPWGKREALRLQHEEKKQSEKVRKQLRGSFHKAGTGCVKRGGLRRSPSRGKKSQPDAHSLFFPPTVSPKQRAVQPRSGRVSGRSALVLGSRFGSFCFVSLPSPAHPSE